MRELCAALRAPMGFSELDPAETAARGHRAERLRSEALSHSYRLSVPAKGFTFGRYRSEQQEIELDGNRPLRALDGALSLDLAGIDEVAFQASPAQVRDWNARKRAGELSLVVQFRPSGEPCAGKAVAGIFRLSGEPLSWQIETDTGPVAAADEDGAPLEVGIAPRATAHRSTTRASGWPRHSRRWIAARAECGARAPWWSPSPSRGGACGTSRS
ncbi:MAG: hypothetical protein E6J85_10300 [Deltaproteobacteria bacterium]|nr:MAG: hypothetical protein E6J85_10300 [Deltaproteobacteria bacterium]